MSQVTEMVLERLVPDLEAEGYEVFVHPGKPLIPSFLGNIPPDAIALRSDKNLIVEVVGGSAREASKIERLSELLRGQNNWELRVVWVPLAGEQIDMKVQNGHAIMTRLAEVRQLSEMGYREAALLMAWATLEAVARAVLKDGFERPQTARRIVEGLATDGFVTPTEADFLRKLATKREKLTHGELQVSVTPGELNDLTTILQTVVDLVPHEQEGAGQES